MTEKIGFVGYESEDIVLFLAYCLKEQGKHVVIEDRSEQGILLRMLEMGGNLIHGEATEVFFQEILVTNAVAHSEDYDMVLMLFGYRLRHPKLYECNKLVLITDTLPAHAALLREIEEWERKQVLLVRNYAECKHGLRYLELLTGQRTEAVFCIPWEERDVRIRNSLGTAEHVRVERLSVQMRDTIYQLLAFLLSDGVKTLQQEKERGKGVWGSWLLSGLRLQDRQGLRHP